MARTSSQNTAKKWAAQVAEMYAMDQSGPSLMKSLNAHGVKPEDIHQVVLTHLHFDHAGGATTEKDGKLVPTFPNAK